MTDRRGAQGPSLGAPRGEAQRVHMMIRMLRAATPDFESLVATHVAFCDGAAPAESCHRLPVAALFTQEITVWGVYDGDALIGIGALKALSPTDGEIKSMHTRAMARGKGAGRLILRSIIAEAEARGYGALWLETGVHPDFAAARALYASHGFTETAPFGSYRPDPHSVFMTRALAARKTAS